MNPDLAALLRKKQSTAAEQPIDWDQRRDQYLTAVNSLYAQIQEFLREPIQEQLVQVQRRSKQLTESYLGTYSVDDLLLIVGQEQVRFSPRGRNILGAAGRVDVLGERAEMVLLVQPDGAWTVLQSREPTLQTEPFTEETFADVLKTVMRA